MSVGHARPRPDEKHTAELKRIWSLPWFQRGLRVSKKLVRDVEIPWLGGSNGDLTHIYIDHRFRGQGAYRGEAIDVGAFVPAVIEHEGVEGILLQFGEYDYDGAHELATAAEEMIARKIAHKLHVAFDRTAYQDMFSPFLAFVLHPPWRNLPADLNVEPYREDAPALYAEIEKQILRAQVSNG
jgi:hypothetical protein